SYRLPESRNNNRIAYPALLGENQRRPPHFSGRRSKKENRAYPVIVLYALRPIRGNLSYIVLPDRHHLLRSHRIRVLAKGHCAVSYYLAFAPSPADCRRQILRAFGNSPHRLLLLWQYLV